MAAGPTGLDSKMWITSARQECSLVQSLIKCWREKPLPPAGRAEKWPLGSLPRVALPVCRDPGLQTASLCTRSCGPQTATPEEDGRKLLSVSLGRATHQ